MAASNHARQRLETLVVRLNALVFTLYGLAFVILPGQLARWITGAAPATVSGLIDMRATYGGMSVAVGVLLFVLASRAASVRAGLSGVLLLMSGMAAGHALGMVVDGPANAVMWIYLCLELVMAVVVAWMLLLRGVDAAD